MHPVVYLARLRDNRRMNKHDGVLALTFDLFGTVLDLSGSLTPPIAAHLTRLSSPLDAAEFWAAWRARQRIEQYQDTIMMLGHSGYLETCRRALVYTLAQHDLPTDDSHVKTLMSAWQALSPFAEVKDALPRLAERYRLVALSNGNLHFLQHLVKNRIGWDFEAVISVDSVGAFKPHPAVYRHAAQVLGLEVGQCMMISANSFDVLGARTCGYRAALVDRNRLPYEDSPLVPDLTVDDFTQLADELAG